MPSQLTSPCRVDVSPFGRIVDLFDTAIGLRRGHRRYAFYRALSEGTE